MVGNHQLQESRASSQADSIWTTGEAVRDARKPTESPVLLSVRKGREFGSIAKLEVVRGGSRTRVLEGLSLLDLGPTG